MDNNCSPNEISLTEVVKSLLVREGDILGTKFRQYLEIAKDVYRDLNLYVVKQSKRCQIQVNKKTHSIRLPDDMLMWTSVSVTNECQQIIPLVLNHNLTGDVIDMNLPNDCACECNCQGTLCGVLKHYETIYKTIAAPMPDGTTANFQCFERKTIYPTGEYYLEYSVPVVVYGDNGDHVATELETKSEFICNLEVEECGCVKDNGANREVIGSCLGQHYLTSECGCHMCPPVQPNATYGYQQLGQEIYFDENFCFDYVLLRYYPRTDKKDLRIPLVAKTAMIRGIKFEALPYELGTGYAALAQQRKGQDFERLYREEKRNLFRLLNRFNLKAFYTSTLGHRTMPAKIRWWYYGQTSHFM